MKMTEIRQDFQHVGDNMADLPIGYKRSDIGVIPQDWRVETISSVADVKTGPFGSALHERDYVDDGTPIITVEHLSEHGIIHHNLPMVSDADRSRLKSYGLRVGDIVFSRVGSVDRNALVSKKEDGWLFSGRLLRVRTLDNTTCPPYLSYHFHSELFKRRVHSVAVGQTMASLNTQILKAVRVVLPTTIEQRAIAEVLSNVDGLLAALDALIAKKRAIKKATMQQLLTGRTRLPGFSGAWETTTLGDVADLKNGYAFKSSTYVSGGMYQIITIANVQDGYLSFNAVNSISELPLDIQEHQKLSYGDLLISMTGNVGRVCIVKETHCLLNQRVGKLLAKGIDELFLYYIVHDRRFLQSMIEMAVGGAQGNLGKTDITGYTCFLPKNLMEQRAIAAVLSDLDAEIAALERRRDKAQAIKQGMMQQLLTGRIRLLMSVCIGKNKTC